MISETQRQNNEDNPRHVNPKPGPQTAGRNRDLEGVTTRQKMEWLSGANITELVVWCTFTSAPASAQAALPIYGQLVIDAVNDAIANSMMTKLDSGSDDSGYLIIPINQLIRIPLNGALSNGSLGGGRIDIKSNDGSTSLDFFVGAN